MISVAPLQIATIFLLGGIIYYMYKYVVVNGVTRFIMGMLL